MSPEWVFKSTGIRTDDNGTYIPTDLVAKDGDRLRPHRNRQHAQLV